MTTDGYQQAIAALQRNGLGERTQEACVRAIGMLVECYGKAPDQITEPD